MAITYQRISGGRLLLNVVTGGDDAEQRRFGDDLDKTARDRRAGEFITVFRQLWSGEPVTFHGDHLFVEDARIVLSGYPHLEEAFSFGEGVLPILAERGLLANSELR